MEINLTSRRAWRDASAIVSMLRPTFPPPAMIQRGQPRGSARRAVSTSSNAQSASYPPPNFFAVDELDDHSSATTAGESSSPRIPTPRSSFAPPPDAFSTFGANPSLLARYLEHPPQPLTLPALLSLSPSTRLENGRHVVKPTEEELLRSANFTRHELPTLLARRVGSFRNLPFIVGSNPYIQRIARLYAESFETIATLGPIMNSLDNQQFTLMLEQLVTDHSQNIPTLARGFLECKKYMDPQAVSAFLDAAIHSRIGIRLIAEQHLSLTMCANDSFPESSTPIPTDSQALPSSLRSSQSPTSVGVIDLALKPADLIRTCAAFTHDLCEGTLGSAPELWLEGDIEATYVGVPVHLEYVITEVLKNSYRATAERHGKRKDRGTGSRSSGKDVAMPPVKVTIAKSAHHLSIRIRDQGGGISPRNLPHVFSYAFTTAGESPEDAADSDASPEEESVGPYAMQSSQMSGGDANALGALGGAAAVGLSTGLGTLAGLGYGLPMARIYATYFGAGSGGSALEIISLYGHGCDTYIKLPSDVLAFS